MNSDTRETIKYLTLVFSFFAFVIGFSHELIQNKENRPCLVTRYDYILLPKTAMCYGIYAIQNTHNWLSEEVR